MVREYYVDQVTQLSEQELQAVFQAVVPPVCLLGGWAVHLHVNSGFQQAYGREYIGSRDIDVGIHVDSDWTAPELREGPVGAALEKIEELGYTRSRFGFVQYFNRETGEKITEEKSKQLPLYEVFEMFVDIIPDTPDLETFNETFGFRPPAEPLLQQVFAADQATPLATAVSWQVPDEVLIADPAILAVMKIRSLPQRDKDQKRVKDLADLHALLWYVTDYGETRTAVRSLATEDDLDTLDEFVDEQLVTAASTLLQVDAELIRASIDRLIT